MNLIIPSYKRSHALSGADYFKSAKYCVPESQRDEYAQVLGVARVLTIPDQADGLITRKRNWILENIPRPLVMVDDDVREIGYYEGRDGTKDGDVHKSRTLCPEQVQDWMDRSADLSGELGCRLWGLSTTIDNRNYKEFLPFSLTSIVLGPFQGHLDHSLTFDDQVGTKDDYDMVLQQFKKYRRVLRLNKFHYLTAERICHWNHSKDEKRGGIGAYRSKDMEEEYCKAIMHKWGTDTISYRIPPTKMSDLLNAQKVNIPFRGV
jgi:hypothetical protein